MNEQVTIPILQSMKAEGKKICVVTAYDYPFARLADSVGIDIILVGDSLGMVVQGEPNTLPVTMDHMIYHTKIVSRAVQRAMVIGDMPFMSYNINISDAIYNAGRLIKEANASAVKLEGGASVCKVIQALTKAGIAVQAHIGLLPQSVHQMGGYKVQKDEDRLLDDAQSVEDAGAFSVVLEGIPYPIAAKITQTLSIPTIGIGAGVECDGQVLVLHDILGIGERRLPKFVKQYANLGEVAKKGLTDYLQDVRSSRFPQPEHCYK